MLPFANSRRARRWARWPLLLLCVWIVGCAATTATRHARDAEQRRDYDRAVIEYTKALRLKPNDTDVRLGLERVKLRASEPEPAQPAPGT